MEVKYKDGIKFINGRSLAEVLEHSDPKRKEYAIIKALFLETNNETELLEALRHNKKDTTPVGVLMCIMAILNCGLSDASPMLEQVYPEGFA